MSTSPTTSERWITWALIAQSWLLQLIAFALLLSCLVGSAISNATGAPLATLQGSGVRLDLGALGACVEGAARVCSVSATHPDFAAPYALAGIPTPLLPALPESLPDLPDLLVFVVTIAAVACIVQTIAVLPRCFALRMSGSRISLYSVLLLKAGIVLSVITLIFGITVASCLRLYIGDAVTDFNTLAKALNLEWKANLGPAFPQLWAALVLAGISSLGQIGLVLTAPTPQVKMSGFQWA